MNYTAPENLLINKTILITGAGDGIGKSLAIKCASLGAKVILLGRTLTKLQAVSEKISALNNVTPAIISMDLNTANEQQYKALAEKLMSEHKKLDGLVHNASYLGEICPFTDIDNETWNEVMQTNVNATFLLTKHLMPLLEQAEAASTIFTTSSVGFKGRALWGAYGVSKFATEGMMQTIADEYQSSAMRFNAINPGATRTVMRANAYPKEDPQVLKTADEILPIYLYLLGDESVDITGQRFNAQEKR
ncbi:YciK family oxidoreductase [Psychromonas aquatilis]|uniref:YciK family oxidoreductase n=1 Tax=Psychromonas aquatilis TaxID=2005072 RepID=A0ABU9GMV2_9GAMM